MEKILIHILSLEYIEKDNISWDLEFLNDVWEKYNVRNIILYESEKPIKDTYNSKFITFYNYNSFEDLKEKSLNLSKKHELHFINAREEKLIQTINKLRVFLWQKTSDHPEMFNDKSIQRELLYKNDLYVSVNYMKFKLSEINFETIETRIWLPFILKPLNWASSAWVVKIKTKKQFDKYIDNYKSFHQKIVEKWFWDIEEIMAEEYINWELYSIDYYINQEWEIVFAKPLKVTLWTDIWINDLFVISWIASENLEKEYDMPQITAFVKRNINATWMRNTFVHHEFKINKKWIYKTIEINWRIWWRRLPMYNAWYGVNLFSLIFDKDIKFNLKTNLNFMKVWACKKWILKGYNEKLLKEVEKLDSFDKIKTVPHMFNKEVWLTKDWFWFIASIQLVNKSNKQLKKDVEFIEEHYCELLDIE